MADGRRARVSLGVPGAALAEARLQCHWAAQPVMAVADALLERAADDGQSNFAWEPSRRALVGRQLAGGFHAALVVDALAIRWVRPGAASEELELAGRTLAEATGWLREQARAAGLRGSEAIRLRDYDMPSHAVADGGRFGGVRPAALGELAGWFANAERGLAEVIARHGGTELRCWPHHFDLGSLIVLDPGADPESARTVGLGMSPGDDRIGEPYFYVNVYPWPEGAPLPPLPAGGHWESEAFLGAALTGSALVQGGEAGGQADRLAAFLEAAVTAGRELLGA